MSRIKKKYNKKKHTKCSTMCSIWWRWQRRWYLAYSFVEIAALYEFYCEKNTPLSCGEYFYSNKIALYLYISVIGTRAPCYTKMLRIRSSATGGGGGNISTFQSKSVCVCVQNHAINVPYKYTLYTLSYKFYRYTYLVVQKKNKRKIFIICWIDIFNNSSSRSRVISLGDVVHIYLIFVQCVSLFHRYFRFIKYIV